MENKKTLAAPCRLDYFNCEMNDYEKFERSDNDS